MAYVLLNTKLEWELCVKTGDELDYSTVIAHVSHAPPQSHVIPIAQILGLKAEKIFKHLKKSIGDKIYKGDVVAVKDGVFSTKKYIADADGELTEVNHHTGEIVIQEESHSTGHTDIMSLVKGPAGTVNKDLIHCKVAKLLAVEVTQTIVERFGGPLIITDSVQAMLLTLPQVQGNIILTQECSEYVVSKLEALGAPVVISTKPMQSTLTSVVTLEKEADLQSIIDFAPTAVYANAAEKTITFYK